MSASMAMVAAFAGIASAQTPLPQPAEFAWRAPVEVPAGAGLVRAELPASALVRIQTARAHDVRVFNSAGEAVPFAWVGPAQAEAAPEQKTSPFSAMPLYTLPAGTRKPPGGVQVHVGGSQPVWVRVDGAAPDAAASPDARPVHAVLFDTRSLAKPFGAIDLDATVPPNTPVAVTVSTSRDLAQWTAAPVRGRIYRFDGERAPSNMRLAFEQPVEIEGRYLRVDWGNQAGVAVKGMTGVIAASAAQPRRVRAPLPPPREVSPDAIEIATGFSTPLAGIALSTPRENTLLPVRVLGRNDDSQFWVILGQTVVYRLNTGEAMSNPPLDLHGASVRQLRIVSTNGAPIGPVQVHAEAEFAPRQLVFVTSGAPPFTLAAGRERAEAAALPSATLTGMLGAKKVEDLPQARIGAPVETPAPQPGWLGGWANRRTVLWAVLLGGVAMLAGVAWSLMRQMK
jgi:hypothetical protein